MNVNIKEFRDIGEFNVKDSVSVVAVKPEVLVDENNDIGFIVDGTPCSGSVRRSILSEIDAPGEGWLKRHLDVGLDIVKNFVSKYPSESRQVVKMNDTVVRILPEKVKIVRPSEVFEKTVQGAVVDRYRFFQTMGGSFELEFIGGQAYNPPSKNDNNFCGVYVSIDGKVKVAPFILTQVCINGMCGRALLSEEGFGIESIHRAWHSSESLVQSLVNLVSVPVEDKASAVRGVFGLLRMTTESRAFKLLMKAVTDREIPNMYEMVQAVTSTANQMASSQGRPNRQLQTIGELVSVWAGDATCSCQACRRPWSV